MIILTVHIDNSNVSSRDHHSLGHHKSQTSGTTSHNSDLVLEREASQRAQVASAALHWLGRGQLALIIWVLEAERIIGTRGGALVTSIFRGSCGKSVVAVLVFGVVLGDFVEFGCDLAEGAGGGAGDGGGGEGGSADGASGLSDNVGAEHCECVWMLCVWVCSKKSTVLDRRGGVVLDVECR